MNFIGEFEHAIATEAKRRGADGVVCGHIHHAADKLIEGIRYINCGDWVESCTAIAEDHDGRLHLIQWERGCNSTLSARSRPSIPMPALC